MARITHLFKTFFPDTQGGLEEAIRQIAKVTIKNNFSVTVLSVSDNPAERYIDKIHCRSFKNTNSNKSNPISIDLVSKFKNTLSQTDILHMHFPWPTGEIITLLYNIKKPIVLTFHCDIHVRTYMRFLYKPFAKAILKKASVIVTTSQNLLNSNTLLNNFREKCTVIPLWLDKDRFNNTSKSEDIINFTKKTHPYGIFIGVLRWYKGLNYLIDASKNISGNIVIVGKGPLYNELKNKIINENIKNVHILGYQSDSNVKYLISKSQFLVLPSTSPAEAFGQVLLEASYLGKPMITTELYTGTSYVNIDGKTGYVVNPNSAIELSDAMNKLFHNNSLIKEFGENAYSRYKNNFTEEYLGKKYIEIYNRLLNSR